MQMTATQIAKILNLSVDQIMQAIQEVGIIYTEERFLSEIELNRLRTVLFRYYRINSAEGKERRLEDLEKKGRQKTEHEEEKGQQNPEAAEETEQQELTSAAMMEELVKDKKIMIDTCSLMHEKCGEVILSMLPLLMKHGKKVIIPMKVIEELKKIRHCFYDAAKRRAAEKGMRICRELQDAGCLTVRGSKNDNFADNVFFVTLSNYRYRHRMLLITQDHGLTYDVLQLNSLHSGGESYPVEVMHITNHGELCVSDMPYA